MSCKKYRTRELLFHFHNKRVYDNIGVFSLKDIK